MPTLFKKPPSFVIRPTPTYEYNRHCEDGRFELLKSKTIHAQSALIDTNRSRTIYCVRFQIF